MLSSGEGSQKQGDYDIDEDTSQSAHKRQDIREAISILHSARSDSCQQALLIAPAVCERANERE